MLEGKKVLIFDMDGTLIDSVGIWNEVDETLIRQIRADGKTELPNVQQQRDAALRRLSKAENPYIEYCRYLKEIYHSPLMAEEIDARRYGIAQNYLENVIDYKKDADRWLKSKQYTLIIASTTKRSNMDMYRYRNANIRSKAKLDDYFTRIYTREDAKEIKPNPEIYLRVMEELTVGPEECLIFEDSLIGMEAAKNAGIEAVAVYDPYSDAERGRIQELADYQISGYTELLPANHR